MSSVSYQYQHMVERIVPHLRNNKNLPFTIPLYNCPSKNPHCKQHHGEVVLRKYIKKNDMWHIEYYSIHENHITFERDHDVDIIKKHLKKSFKKRLLTGEDIVHLLPYHNKCLVIRLSEQENQMFITDSKKLNLSMSDYIRKRLKLDLIRDQKS